MIPRVACVMMQKDERYLLEPWLAYYGNLFGFENLFVLDNGSKLHCVRQTLARYEEMGVTINRLFKERYHYDAKGEYLGCLIRALDSVGDYDFIIPLDCDEFVCLKTEQAYDFSPGTILDYLADLKGERRVLRFPYQLANHPLQADIYYYFSFFKVFFASSTFDGLDHGHHVGRSKLDNGIRDTDLVQLHFHHKIFDSLIEQAKTSWVGNIAIGELHGAANYQGPSTHLAAYFSMTKEDYYEGFLRRPYFFLPEFRALIESLGVPLRLPVEPIIDRFLIQVVDESLSIPLDAPGVPVLIPRMGPTGIEFIASKFDEASYLKANPDLISAKVDPSYHFTTYGFREGRPVRPESERDVELAINFSIGGNCKPYLRDGWSSPEPGQTYTEGTVSTIALTFDHPGRRYNLEIWLNPLIVAEKVPRQTLRIAVSDMLLNSTDFTTAGWQKICCEIPPDVTTQGKAIVSFFHPDAARPCDVSSTLDFRALALAFRQLILWPWPNHSSSIVATPFWTIDISNGNGAPE